MDMPPLSSKKIKGLISYTILTLTLEFLILFLVNGGIYLQRLYISVLGLKLDLVGFIVPFLISLFLLIVILCFMILRRSNLRFTYYDLIFLIVWMITIALSFFIPTIKTKNNGAGFSVPLLTLAPLIIAYHLVEDEDYKLILPLAWIIGFLVGAFSDIISTFGVNPLIGGVWGGGGLFDLDMLIPIILTLSVLIFFILKKIAGISNKGTTYPYTKTLNITTKKYEYDDSPKIN